jgi:putative N6-adenine-specific DNA methylase
MNTYLASCALGLEKVLANELRALDFKIVKNERGRLFFTGAEPSAPYRANLWLRTAERVLLLAADFHAPEFGALFDGVAAVPWEDYLKPTARIVIDTVRTHGSALTSIPTIQSVVQKAVSERLCKKAGLVRLPDTGERAAIRVYLENDRAEICLDLSAESLHKRGYRKDAGEAPLKETIAAGIILFSGWRRKFPLIDPFCGSGTIPIEAALYALDVAPGIGRKFAVENMVFHDAKAEADVREAAKAAVRTDCRIRIAGSDIDPNAIEMAERNLASAFQTAGISPADAKGFVKFSIKPMETLAAEDEEPGFIIANPPYGERLGDMDKAAAIYRTMGKLPAVFPGWTMAILSTHPGFETAFGRYATTRKDILNGSSKASLYEFR